MGKVAEFRGGPHDGRRISTSGNDVRIWLKHRTDSEVLHRYRYDEPSNEFIYEGEEKK